MYSVSDLLAFQGRNLPLSSHAVMAAEMEGGASDGEGRWASSIRCRLDYSLLDLSAHESRAVLLHQG